MSPFQKADIANFNGVSLRPGKMRVLIDLYCKKFK